MARFTIKNCDVFVEQWNESAHNTLVLLHGFTGSTKTWHQVIKELPKDVRYIAVDLVGHGKSAAPTEVEKYSMAFQIDLLDQLFDSMQLQKFTLLGYSMGGRVALSYAVKYPQKIEKLLLESASPGLSDEQQHIARKQADELLAEKIMQNGLVSFVDKWENIPLFATQKQLAQGVQQAIREERLSQRELGLANSLRGMGTGIMPALWDELATLPMSVTLITGALDEKFVNLNKQMQERLPKAKHIIIPAVGHAIHVENPTKFATIVKEEI